VGFGELVLGAQHVVDHAQIVGIDQHLHARRVARRREQPEQQRRQHPRDRRGDNGAAPVPKHVNEVSRIENRARHARGGCRLGRADRGGLLAIDEHHASVVTAARLLPRHRSAHANPLGRGSNDPSTMFMPAIRPASQCDACAEPLYR
jgi:hypothetical protein